ncbi:MAG: ABC transporter ATP-binding protein [Myxococcota bacterium]|nr:ABC transporter ATP-binding protein [Myxococcota bacterium]
MSYSAVAESPVVMSVQDVHKRFDSNHVLKGISLDFREGTTTVILGGSGSGKTVLMKHLIGLLSPDEGHVFVDGEDISGLKGQALNNLRMKFGMVFQWAALFDSMNVYENVAFPLREHEPNLDEEEVKKRVAQKLALFGLEGIEAKNPADLSGGMRKRVGLARAIMMNPRIVLYDEPTTGLDPITTKYVDDMILRAARELKVTSVVISHDIASAFNVADYIAFLYQGEIVEYGTPAQLRKSEHPFVSEFLDTWFGRQ